MQNNSISGRILEGSRALWDGFNAHPFVMGIAKGTLSLEQFKYFMIQDYLYLMEYAKVFAIGSAKTDDEHIAKAFTEYVSNIQNGELDVHRGYMERLGISLNDVLKEKQAQDNLSYTSYMIRIAYECGPAEICAAILPCAVSYEHIAAKMIKDDPKCVDHPFFGDWIKSYSSNGYHIENKELIELTDRAAKGYNEEQILRLVEIGKRCSCYEKLFWDMSWEMRKAPC